MQHITNNTINSWLKKWNTLYDMLLSINVNNTNDLRNVLQYFRTTCNDISNTLCVTLEPDSCPQCPVHTYCWRGGGKLHVVLVNIIRCIYKITKHQQQAKYKKILIKLLAVLKQHNKYTMR